MITVRDAERIARLAHRKQKDKFNGEPYELHLERVASDLHVKWSDDAIIVAWLHDILEDTPFTEQDLIVAGLEYPQLQALLLLTRDGVLTYSQYIDKIVSSENEIAVSVKLADLLDHLRETSPKIPEAMKLRYERALRKLRDVL